MLRKLYSRTFLVQSQMCVSLVKHIGYTTTRTKEFNVISSSPNKFTINKSTTSEITFESDPKVHEIRKIFGSTNGREAISVYTYFTKNNIEIDLNNMNKVVKWLHRLGAETSIIANNCHLFSVPMSSLKKTYSRLKFCNWKQFIDFMPLLSIDESKIQSIQKNSIFEIRNRVYLFSEHFRCDPHIVSHHCAKHLFMFEINLKLLNRKLALLENNISTDYILRDLDLLARSESKIKARIDYLQMNGHTFGIMPWMIKCDTSIIKRTIEIRRENVGTKSMDTLELIRKKLNLHGRTAVALFTKHKFLRELNYETALERVDELLKVFTPKEIGENIILLNHPVAHIKIRVAELNAFDPSCISPKACGMSQQKFMEYKKSIKK